MIEAIMNNNENFTIFYNSSSKEMFLSSTTASSGAQYSHYLKLLYFIHINPTPAWM